MMDAQGQVSFLFFEIFLLFWLGERHDGSAGGVEYELLLDYRSVIEGIGWHCLYIVDI